MHEISRAHSVARMKLRYRDTLRASILGRGRVENLGYERWRAKIRVAFEILILLQIREHRISEC